MGIPDAQPTAAHGESAAAAAASQLGQDSSVSELAVQIIGSAAVSNTIDSAGPETTAPADLTGAAASSAHHSQERMHRLVPAGELAMQTEGEADKTAVDVQHVQAPSHAQTAAHGAELEPVRGLADPNKRLLAKMGSHAPSDVSKQLLQEVAARSHVEGLLQVCRLPIVLGPGPTVVFLTYHGKHHGCFASSISRQIIVALHHGPTNLCGDYFSCFAVWYFSMVPANLPSQLGILSTSQTYFKTVETKTLALEGASDLVQHWHWSQECCFTPLYCCRWAPLPFALHVLLTSQRSVAARRVPSICGA